MSNAKKTEFFEKLVETAQDKTRVMATLKRAVIAKVDKKRGELLIVVTAPKPGTLRINPETKEQEFVSSEEAGTIYHSMLYPCNADGTGVNWDRSVFFCGNGETVDEAIAEVRDTKDSIDLPEYPVDSEVVAVKGGYETIGVQGIVRGIYPNEGVHRNTGLRYHVNFYDGERVAGEGALIAMGNFRRDQLELLNSGANSQEANDGN